jgi:glycosyltransferase involved in cell wall biosynthesis
MRQSHSWAALIPCRDEAVALPGLLQEVRRFLPAVLVVDDGSRDATGAIAREMGVDCLALWPGQGKGAALQAGFRHLEVLGFSHAVTLDGDGRGPCRRQPNDGARVNALVAPRRQSRHERLSVLLRGARLAGFAVRISPG